ncbi:MAG: tetratricopeptide repeat protein [Gammaproteobacteria bacterium]|nr:tetratricopeptide repeat protein [Gammaproteobacteria bacterium]
MAHDVFAEYRINNPLTEDELNFIESENFVDFKDLVSEYGIGLQTDGQGHRYLVPSEDLDQMVRIIENSVIPFDSSHQYVQPELDYIVGVRSLELRVALVAWGEEYPQTLDCVFELAVALANERGDYRQALGLHQYVLTLREKALGKEHPDTIFSMRGVADCLRSLGRDGKALSLLRKALKLSNALLGARHIDSLHIRNEIGLCLDSLGGQEKALQWWTDLVELNTEALGRKHVNTLESQIRLGSLLREQGHAEKALTVHQEVFDLASQVLEEEDHVFLFSLHELALSRQEQGQLEEARLLHERSLALHEEVYGESGTHAAISRNNLATCLESLGLYDEALPIFQDILDHETRTLGEDHPATLSTLLNVANCMGMNHQEATALPLLRRHAEINREIWGSEHPETLSSLSSLADCLQDLEKLEEALPIHKEVWRCYKKLLGKCHPLTLGNLWSIAQCLNDLELLEQSLPYRLAFIKALSEEPMLTKDWASAVTTAGVWLANAAYFEYPIDWGVHFRSLSRAFVTVLDLQPPEQTASLWSEFVEFHSLFLDVCLELRRSDLIPGVLAALQGRQLAALMLEELDQKDVGNNREQSKVIQRLRNLRRKLRQATLGLQVIDGGKDKSENRVTTEHRNDCETDLVARHKQLTQYKKFYADYRKTLSLLSQLEPSLVEVTPPLDISPDRLRHGLTEQEALLLIVNTQVNNKNVLLAVFVTAEIHKVIRLGEAMRSLPTRISKSTSCRSACPGTRDTLGQFPSPQNNHSSGSMSTEDIQAILDRYFWRRLKVLLRGINSLHLVTHGAYHTLPYDLGCPEHLTLQTYPGLVFYYQRRCLPRPPAADKPRLPRSNAPLGVQSYSAWETDNPIPLVDAEIKLVTTIWSDAVQPPSNGAETGGDFFHFAGHGFHSDDDPLSASLLLENNTRLDCRQLLNSSFRPRLVYLSSCVVGRTNEDLNGEPLGLVSAFLLRGTEYVIAALQPVSDLLMPLLAILFHQAWQSDLNPPDALREAKKRLRSGEWYPDTADLVSRAYGETLNDYLTQVMDESPPRQTRLLGRLVWWPIVPAGYEHAGEGERSGGLKSAFATEKGRQHWVKGFVQRILDDRKKLPVDDLLPWVRCFGGAYRQSQTNGQ